MKGLVTACWGLLAGATWVACEAPAGIRGAPFLLNPAVDISGQPTDAWDHRVVSGSNTWLVIWADTGNIEIAGLRLDALGQPLDPLAFPIAPSGDGAHATVRRYPAATWFRDAFWTAWEEYRGSGCREGFGRRLYPDGRFADPASFPVETWMTNAYRSCICGGSTNLLMTWCTYSNLYRLWVQTYSPEGRPLGGAIQVLAGLPAYLQPGLAFGDFASGEKSWLLVVPLSNDIRGLRISEGGTALDSVPLPICLAAGTQDHPATACGPGPGATQGWWVAWEDARTGNGDVYGAFVNQDGAVSHSSTGTLFIGTAEEQRAPTLCSDGTRYLLGWEDYRDPPALRVSVMDAAGTLSDTNGTLVATNDMVAPMLDACAPGAFLAVHGEDSVWATPVAAQESAVAVGTQRLVSVAGACERYNSGGCDGTNYWVAFEYHPAEPTRHGDIALQGISADGAPLFPSPIPVCTNSGDQWGPAAAVGQDTVYVVWTDDRNPRDQVWGQRLTLGGTRIGTNVQIGAGTSFAYFPDIASDGTNFLVVWDDSSAGKMRGRFLKADGGMGSAFDVGGSDISNPSVTFGGGYFLTLCADDATIRFRRYRPGGTAVDTAASNLYSSGSLRWAPKAAYHPGNHQFLVTWRDQATSQILGRTLDASTAAGGSVITALVIDAWTASENSAVACDGTHWVCLFKDMRRGISGLYGARVDAGGAVLDPSPFPILPGGAFGALIGSGVPGKDVLLLGSKIVYEHQGRTYNTRKNMGMFWQPGPQETPGALLETTALQLGSGGRHTLSFRQSPPASTGYVVEAGTALADPDWHPVTNASLLDSGVSVSAQWEEAGGATSCRVYRVRGK